jgi:hypothetical protein
MLAPSIMSADTMYYHEKDQTRRSELSKTSRQGGLAALQGSPPR